ncbi:serine/threonine kinase 17, partial [Schistosoma bovis]
MSSRRDSCLRFSKPHHSWKNFYKVEGDPIGRGYAGKVYKITTGNMELLDPLIVTKSQLTATMYSESAYTEPGEYLACKVIRRFRGGKDTIAKITSEVQAMVSLQRDHLNTYHNSVYNKPSEKPSRICNHQVPPKSASPKLFAVYKDSMEVAIIMEYSIFVADQMYKYRFMTATYQYSASGGSLYDLCRSAYPYDFAASSTSSPYGDLSIPNSGVSNSHTTIPQSKHPGSFDGLSESYIRQLLISILEALVYMHDTLRMVHLDVKAENLLLRQPYPSTDVFFTDFGLATILTEGKQHRELAGTPDYV